MEEKPVLYISTVSQNENLPVVLRPCENKGREHRKSLWKATTIIMLASLRGKWTLKPYCYRVSIIMVCRHTLRSHNFSHIRPQTLKAVTPENPVINVSRAKEWEPTTENLGLDSLSGKVVQPLHEVSMLSTMMMTNCCNHTAVTPPPYAATE